MAQLLLPVRYANLQVYHLEHQFLDPNSTGIASMSCRAADKSFEAKYRYLI